MRALIELRQLLPKRLETFLAGPILLARQSLLLDLKLNLAPFDLVDLLRETVDLDAQPAGRLVDEIDRLVGKVPVTHVPIGEGGRRNQSVIRYPYSVMHFIALLQAT